MKPIKYFENRKISITFRITAMYSIVMSLMMIVLSFVNFQVVNFMIVETSKAQLNEDSKDLRTYLEKGDIINSFIFEEASINPDLYLRIVDENGHIIFQNKDDLVNLAYDAKLSNHQIIDDGSIDLVLLNEKMKFKDKVVYTQLAIDMNESENFMSMMYRSLLVINIFGICISILLGIYLTKRTLKPIEDIAETAKNISIHDLSERIYTSGPDDEIKNLARTFNDMIERLETAIEKQKRFISDASHELRTPISVIQGYANLLDRWGKKDEAVLDESVKAIKSEAEGMKKLFEQLLILTKEDHSSFELEFEKFYINQLIDEIVFESKLVHSKPIIKILDNPDLIVYAEQKSIKQLLRIIVDNSLKYTDDEGEINIILSQQNQIIKIQIIDTGVGISEEDLPYIFDRFYRADKSRSKTNGGTGLGLSIAKLITKSHKGRIYVKSEINKGTEITIELPQNLE